MRVTLSPGPAGSGPESRARRRIQGPHRIQGPAPMSSRPEPGTCRVRVARTGSPPTEGSAMGDVTVIQFCTLDGVVSDPDGRWGTGHGGWAFRQGAGPVRSDQFRLGHRMEHGVQLYGRR